MEKVKQFVEKYALFILIVGFLVIIITGSLISNLPNPMFLYPGESTRRYYTPLRIYQFFRWIGIIITLVGAFFFAKNLYSLTKSNSVDTDKITYAIGQAISNVTDKDQGGAGNGIYAAGVGAQTVAPRAKTKVIEIEKTVINGTENYVLIDEKGNQIVGLNKILNYYVVNDYRIVNTVETSSSGIEKIQIILEK